MPYVPSQGVPPVPCSRCRAMCDAVLHEVLIDVPYQQRQEGAAVPLTIAARIEQSREAVLEVWVDELSLQAVLLPRMQTPPPHRFNAKLPDEVAQGDFSTFLAVAEKTQFYPASPQRRVRFTNDLHLSLFLKSRF